MNVKVKTAAPGLSWLVYEDDRKIAAVHRTDQGFLVAQQGVTTRATNTKAVRKKLGVAEWEPEEEIQSSFSKIGLDGYSTDTDVYFDPVIELRRKLPLFTKVAGSKCYFAAGWYRVQIGSKYKVMHCPKLLTLNRNRFWGPFYTKEEAESLNI